ncbi:hypothetical protein [Sulfitobacter sabulilitoris]|uniref:Gamma-glutamyl kinase n=1 Tax=Sulfitobacter sabulilitoris TaxID=2562655 RepID=A0A5S3PLM9_9RHOB|nr:hypothetical protein [Sulfitobacter sabulilitoris]TMM55318.1 hypothetical protein FDT80_07130 [Sulfitobacter sabulilitoris]
MLVFLKANLAFLAVPKTGTTAVEMALKPRADVIFARGRKHTTAARYHNKVAPFLHDTFGTRPEAVAVLRDPVEQIRSWYRYRSGPRQTGTKVSTRGCSFDDFVLAVIADDPPDFAGIGSQHSFLTSGSGTLLVTHLFAYEAQPAFRGFLSDRLDTPVNLKPKNVSPAAAAPLSPRVEQALRAARAADFALHDRLVATGGYIHTEIGTG